ncbi:MAG: hypothetical protein HOI35_05485 [Woeseia sp.]|jgi:hypothetical protein|nr:hypothetical protein [Woeseia sp.]MBT6209452.1 hypothetical protein [Woeseia sp.]
MQIKPLTRTFLPPIAVLAAIAFSPISNAEEYPLEDDVSSIDGIINAYYSVVSGPAGYEYQADRDRSLHAPHAMITRVTDDGELRRHTVAIEQESLTEPYPDGFYEEEINRVVHEYRDLAHVWSTFELRRTPDGPAFTRGISDIALYFYNDRWWISSWSTQYENDIALPDKYLPDSE